jgi:hypothetical protein
MELLRSPRKASFKNAVRVFFDARKFELTSDECIEPMATCLLPAPAERTGGKSSLALNRAAIPSGLSAEEASAAGALAFKYVVFLDVESTVDVRISGTSYLEREAEASK